MCCTAVPTVVGLFQMCLVAAILLISAFRILRSQLPRTQASAVGRHHKKIFDCLLSYFFPSFFFKFAARAGLLHQTSRLINYYRQWRAGFFPSSTVRRHWPAARMTTRQPSRVEPDRAALPIPSKLKERRIAPAKAQQQPTPHSTRSTPVRRKNKTKHKNTSIYSPLLCCLSFPVSCPEMSFDILYKWSRLRVYRRHLAVARIIVS